MYDLIKKVTLIALMTWNFAQEPNQSVALKSLFGRSGSVNSPKISLFKLIILRSFIQRKIKAATNVPIPFYPKNVFDL